MDWALARAGRSPLTVRRPLVMAIINATPDSFSDGGLLPHEPRDLERHVVALVEEGADILDVGGESTRPGHEAVSADEELRRVLPVLRAIRAVDAGITVSIDTSKARVAEAALRAGADVVNDVHGLAGPGMADVVRENGCSAIVMRHRPLAGDVVDAAVAELRRLADAAAAAGIPRERLVLDPGLGFGDPPGSDVLANLRLACEAPRRLPGVPVLVGASRKRFLGLLTGEPDPRRRVAASVGVALMAAASGAAVLRVHDVAATAAALRAAQAEGR